MGRDQDSESLYFDEAFEEPCTVTGVKGRKLGKPGHLHHLQEQHDCWVGRGLPCPYCRVGSIIMSREDINRGIDH